MNLEYDDPDPELAERARRFVDEVVLPAERDLAGASPDAVPDDLVHELRERARERNVYAPQIDPAFGGMGRDLRTALPVFEQAGRSVLAAPALRVNTPDQANLHVLERLATPAQRERWLRPIAAGEARSAFAITEPPPGAGSDPAQIQTTAARDGDGWVLDGHKWWTTQGVDADVLFVVARTDPGTDANAPTDADGSAAAGAASTPACTIFLVPADAEGVRVVREFRGAAGHGLAGHAELRFDGVRLPGDAVLGEVDRGLEHARERVPASRLGRSMRSAGMAMRALSVATAYASERRVGETPLASKQTVRFELAEAAAAVRAVRTLIRDAAARFVAGERALQLAACATVTRSHVEDVVGTAVEVCGGHGVAPDLPLAGFYERAHPTNSRLSGVGGKRRIADAVLDEACVDRDELGPMTRFWSE